MAESHVVADTSRALPLHLLACARVERAVLDAVLVRPGLVSYLARRRPLELDGRRLDPELAALLALDDLAGSPLEAGISPARARRKLAVQLHSVDSPPPLGVRHEDRTADGGDAPIPVRLYTPPCSSGVSPAVVYYHGGGFVTGSVAVYDAHCRRLAVAVRCRVLSVEYRLAPEHRFPAAVDDALAAFRWVARVAPDLGVDPARIAVAGDSAGANLSAVVARRTRDDAVKPALQVLLYPCTDATQSRPSHTLLGRGYLLSRDGVEWHYRHYLGCADARHPDVSPLLAGDHGGLPPALVYTAGFDPLRDEGRDYAEKMRAAGVRVLYREYPELVHGFAQLTVIRTAREALGQAMVELGRSLHLRPPTTDA